MYVHTVRHALQVGSMALQVCGMALQVGGMLVQVSSMVVQVGSMVVQVGSTVFLNAGKATLLPGRVLRAWHVPVAMAYMPRVQGTGYRAR